MIAPIPKPPISQRQKAAALIVAGTADFLQITLLPLLGLAYPLDDAIDIVCAIILILICGIKWQFVLAFLIELVPGLDLFPTWTAVVLLMSTYPDRPVEQPRPVLMPPISQAPPQIEVSATVVPPVQPPSTQVQG